MLQGIDVSSYQSTSYPTAGLSFVFIKVTEGLSYVNPEWVAQRATARAAGLVTGFYHYPKISNGGTTEADRFLSQINLQPGDILCLDWEWYGQTVSDQAARDYKSAFLARVKAKAPNHKVIVYANRDDWLNVDTDSQCGDGLWIADYVTAGQPRVQHPWLFHQYTDTPEDEDVASPQFTTLADLKAWAGASTPAPAPTPVPAPKPVPAPVAVPQWRQLLDHVMAVPERVYEHWVSGTGWDNVTAWGTEYGEQGVPWCVIWDWCMYNETGLAGIVPKVDNVAAFTTWAQQHGQWSEYPSIGAWVNFGGGGHTELVIGFDATTVYTKGGNSVQAGATDNGQGNGVFTHSRARTDTYVTGYLAPRFPDGHCPPTADPHDPRGGTAQTSYTWPGPAAPAHQETDMPQWLPGQITPGPQPTVVLVPRGNAWTAATHRTLHLGMDHVGDPTATAHVRVAVHNGTTWGQVITQTVTAAGGTVDVDVTGACKVSLDTDQPGVAYAVETW